VLPASPVYQGPVWKLCVPGGEHLLFERMFRGLGFIDLKAQARRLRDAPKPAGAAMWELKRRTKMEKERTEWVKPPGEISAAAIAATVGMSVRSPHKHPGPRAEAREKVR
jgi:hypothetical protein